MTKEVLINVGSGETRIAVVEDRVLESFHFYGTLDDVAAGDRVAPSRSNSAVGDVVLGRVSHVMPATQAAFVEIGLARAGYLTARDAALLAGRIGAEVPPVISDCVRQGDVVLLQIVKDSIGGKGARLSANLAFPGRYLVFMPVSARIAVSRRIVDEAERARLAALAVALAPAGSGFIVRTAAAGVDEAALRADASALAETWHAIGQARQTASVPAVLHRDLDPVERILRDEAAADRVRIDHPETLARARAFCQRALPEMADRLEAHAGPEPLFESAGIEDEIATLHARRVGLPSDGWITIETTQACTAIDVNSGSYAAGADLAETGQVVNAEAARVIARQLRLRGIGGLVVIDFIDPASADHAAHLMAVFARALAKDRAPVRVVGPSEFGVVQLTRKRVGEGLEALATQACACCEGSGRQRTAARTACDLLRAVERAAGAAPGKTIVARAAPEVVAWLEAREVAVRRALASRGVARFALQANDAAGRDSFDVKTVSQ